MAATADKSNFVPLDKSHKSHKLFFATNISLRVLALAVTLSASSIILTNKETVTVFGIVTNAKYNYSPSFKFFAYANLIVCAFTFLSLVLSFIFGKRARDPIQCFYMFLHDLIMTVLLMAGCAAATAVGYVGKYGNNHAGWMPICRYLAKYCDRATVATVLSYFGFLLYLILTVVSAHKSRQTIISDI